MPQSETPLRLGTRGSRLALAQAGLVRAGLAEHGISAEIVVISTSGDRIQDRPLADAGGKGLFTKELEHALLEHRIDIAVHSMKDVPVKMPDGLAIGAILPRETPSDAFISSVAPTLADLPRCARIGTSSVRRQAQIARARPDLQILLLRGNVDTRLAKLAAGDYDAIILALAGLKRLRLEGKVTSLLDPPRWLPALAQGAIGVQIRMGDGRLTSQVAPLDHPESAIALACERAFQDALDGSCRTPIAGLATVAHGRLEFSGEIISPDGTDHVATQFEISLNSLSPVALARERGREAGLKIKSQASPWLAR